MNIRTRLISFLLALLQIWVPISLGIQSTSAVAQVASASIVPNAGEGQAAGNFILRQQLGTVQNTQIVDTHVTDSSASNFQGGAGQFNLQEFGMGGNINEAMQGLQTAYDNPHLLNDAARQIRRDMQERGCRATSFQYVRSATVLKVTPIKVTLKEKPDGSIERTEAIDTNFSGEVKISYPTLGGIRKFDQIVTSATLTQVGTVLRYELTPFTSPNDGSFFTYNHRIAGSAGTPVISDYGNKANGFSTTSLVYAKNGQTITVTADLYRVNRTFSKEPPGGCPLDPNGCVVSGISFCNYPGLGIWDVFNNGTRTKTAAQGLLMDAVSAQEIPETDYYMAPIVARGSQVLNGSDPVFTEIFTGCQETSNSSTNSIKVHQTDIKTCSMPLVDLPLTCNGTRGTRFVQMQESTILSAKFYQRVKIPVIDPKTGKQVVGTDGKPVFTEQDKPAIYSGAVDINVPTFGGFRSWSSDPDASGYFAKYELTPFSVSPLTYFPYNPTGYSDGGVSVSISSLGGKDDNWTLAGSASVSSAAEMKLNVTLYQVMNNTIIGCEDYLKHAADAFCTASMTCTDYRGPCTTLDGVSFCDGSGAAKGVAELLRAWGTDDSAQNGGNLGNGIPGGGPLNYLDTMCWAGTGKKMDCSAAFSGGMNCWTDINGNQQCGTVDKDNLANNFGEAPTHLDDCASPANDLLHNPKCTLVSNDTCTEGALGIFSGTCYNKTVIYDCGVDKEVKVQGNVSYSATCGGALRCMGTECHNPKAEANFDFGRAVTSGNVVDMAARDMVCAETGGAPTTTTQACTPLIFQGENLWCKIPSVSKVGMAPNCCEQANEAAAQAPDAIQYVQVVMHTYKLATDKAMLSALARVPGLDGFSQSVYSAGGAVQTAIDGAISLTKNFLMDSASTVAKTFGYSYTAPSATTVAKDFVLDPSNVGMSPTAMATMNEWLRDAGMDQLADMLFSFDATEGIVQLTPMGEQLFGAVQMIGTVFMIYSILKIIGHIIFKCEKSELELGIQKKQRNCHYVGNYCSKKVRFVGCVEKRESYCCYKTPLARMVAEQIRMKAPHIAGDYGDASNPRCGGFTPQQLAAFDWSLFDPNEWIMLLQEGGLIPETANEAETMWGLNSSRAAIATGKPIDNEIPITQLTTERYTPRVDSFIQNREALAKEPVCFNDPKQMAWYQKTPTAQDVVRVIGGTGRVETCGVQCIDVYLGQVGDNYISDWCSSGKDQYFTVAVDMPQFIDSAHLLEAQWDDHIQVDIGGTVVYQSPGFGNPPPVCELGASWCWGTKTAGGVCSAAPPNDPGGSIDVTSLFKAGGEITTNTRVWVGGGGEGFARVRLLWGVPVAQSVNCISPSGVETE